MSTILASPTRRSPSLDSSPLPSPMALIRGSQMTSASADTAMSTQTSSLFRSVRELLPVSDIVSENGIKSKSTKSLSSKTIRSNKENIKSKQSTLGTKNGKISGKITKPSSTAILSSVKTSKNLSNFDVYTIPSSPRSSPLTPPKRPQSQSQDDALLETPPAEDAIRNTYVPAKRIWTPAQENTRPEIIDLCDSPEVGVKSFTAKLSEYRCATEESSENQFGTSGPPTKRRCLDLVNVSNQSAQPKEKLKKPKAAKAATSPKSKPKKVKKTPRTITGIATAPYQSIVSEKDVQLPEFDDTINATVSTDTVSTMLKPKPGNDKAKKTSKKGTKEVQTRLVPEKPLLLSPASVRKSLDNQLLVFGTSSQLLQDSSPESGWNLKTTGQRLKTIQTHAKIHTSAANLWEIGNEDDDDNNTLETSMPSIFGAPLETECTANTTGWGIGELEISKDIAIDNKETGSGKSLWGAASRGFGGALHEVEVVDLIDEDDLDDIIDSKPASIPDPDPIPSVSYTQAIMEDESLRLDTDFEIYLPADVSAKKPSAYVSNPAIDTGIAKSSSTTVITSSKTMVKEVSKSTSETLHPRPNFDGFTLIQLQAEIKGFGFKPIKKREDMIRKLNQCWDAYERTISIEMTGNANITPEVSHESSTVQAKRVAKITTKKATKKTTAAIGEDANVSDVEAPAPKKRGRKPKATVSDETVETTEKPAPKARGYKPKAAAAMIIDNDATEVATISSSRKEIDHQTLFKHITTAIKAQTPSTDLTKPSYWQKVLMYEPIVIEDFTEWLVNEGFHGAGLSNIIWKDCGVCELSMDCDEAIDFRKVKCAQKWCEKCSVCFVKREKSRW